MTHIHRYLTRSEGLLNTAEQFRAALAVGDAERESIVQDLIFVSRQGAAEEFELHYGMGEAPTITKRPDNLEDGLSAILLDVQSANLLMSAGLALNEGGARGPNMFDEAVNHIEEARMDAKAELSKPSHYAAAAAIKSDTLDSARETFTTNSQAVLSEFVAEAAKVINSVVEQLKKLESAKILEAMTRLGASVPVVPRVGRLIRLGIEKLQSALDALTRTRLKIV